MGSKFSGLGRAVYDSKRREVLGRDGGGWAKLGVFYFFFYLGLAGFFCAMLAIFMSLTPRDHPYYYSHDSRMETRSNPLAPGLGFRPQPAVDKNLIVLEEGASSNENPYAKSLDNYLRVYYPSVQVNKGNSRGNKDKRLDGQQFSLRNVGDCTNTTQYGYTRGKPCVLVKLNKIVGFKPEPFAFRENLDTAKEVPQACQGKSDSIPVVCTGEFPADADNIGKVSYFSKNGFSHECGSLPLDHFPYGGKIDREDVYQAPYVWAQFTNPKPNVLINVICRAYAGNIEIDKKTGRGITRFQLFVTSKSERQSGAL